MQKIPKPLVEEMENDTFYKKCCITGETKGKIDWHHNLIYAGKQVNRKFCILPLAQSVHREIVKHKEICDWIMLNRATEQELAEFSKAIDYKRARDKLNEKYGHYKN
jgi:hypothetical protein